MTKSAPKRSAPKQNKPAYSRAEYRYEVTIYSAAAQKVTTRTLKRVSRALYTIGVVLYAIGDGNEADQFELIVGEMLDAVADNLANATEEMVAKRDAAGIDAEPVYTNPIKLVFRISSPTLGQYAQLIRGLDDYARIVDALRLTGSIRNRKALDAVFERRNEILDLGQELIRLEGRARTAALKAGKLDDLAEADARPDVVVDSAEDQPVEGADDGAPDEETSSSARTADGTADVTSAEDHHEDDQQTCRPLTAALRAIG